MSVFTGFWVGLCPFLAAIMAAYVRFTALSAAWRRRLFCPLCGLFGGGLTCSSCGGGSVGLCPFFDGD